MLELLLNLDAQTLVQARTRYLSDETGRGVTPDFSHSGIADLPMDTLSLISAKADEAEKAAHKSFLKAHRNNRVDDKASAEETRCPVSTGRAAHWSMTRGGRPLYRTLTSRELWITEIGELRREYVDIPNTARPCGKTI